MDKGVAALCCLVWHIAACHVVSLRLWQQVAPGKEDRVLVVRLVNHELLGSLLDVDDPERLGVARAGGVLLALELVF